MSSIALAGYLRSTNLVSSHTAEEIAGWFIPRLISKNDFFLEEGKFSNEYLFLEKGFMRAFAFNLDGHDITTNFYSENQVVLEASSFFNRTRSKENIQALEDCAGWYINYERLNDLFHSLPEFREFGRSVLVKGLTHLKTKMLSLITETAEQRYNTLINTQPEIFNRAPLKHIASYLGITDTSLSRIRKEYSKK